MIQLIVGKKGKGKTKHLLAKVNDAIKGAKGNIVYLDKSSKHMYELNNKVRLINVKDYGIENCDEFVGFIAASFPRTMTWKNCILTVSLRSQVWKNVKILLRYSQSLTRSARPIILTSQSAFRRMNQSFRRK